MSKRLFSSETVTIISLFSALFFLVFLPSSAQAANRNAPVQNNIDRVAAQGDTHYLMVGRGGLGNGLDAPDSTVVFYFPENENNPQFRIYDGQQQCHWGSGNLPDTNGASPTSFNIYRGSEPTNLIRSYNHNSFPCGWSNWINLPSGLPTETLGNTTFKVATFEAARSDPPWAQGGNNAFRLQLSSGGKISYYSESGDYFAMDNRTRSLPNGGNAYAHYSFYFGPDCSVDGNQKATLRWSDDDRWSGNQTQSIFFRLFEYDPSGANVRTYILENNGNHNFNNTTGWTGENTSGRADFTVRPGHKYLWKWYNVSDYNGVQYELPFNSIYYDVDCTPPPPPVEGNLTCTPLSTSQIRISVNYQDATNNVQVRRGGSTIRTYPSGTRTRQFTDSGLQPGTSYTYRLIHEGSTLATDRCRTENATPADEHKIFGANSPEVGMQYVRDNRRFGVDLNTALWPDAAMRTNRRATNLWLAGVWGGSRDNATSDRSRRANPNHMSSFNYAAENDCPGNSCLERVPMAYVPQNDGLGYSTTSLKDGSTTPAGNNWVSIREESFGGQSGSNVSSCGSYNNRYNPKCGGMASRLNTSLNGRSGNWIEVVEVSNIHVRGVGLTGSTTNGAIQGGINGTILQHDVRNTRNLPSGSQGPRNASGNAFNAWDNIRSPSDPNGVFTLSINNPNAKFEIPGGGVKNFTYNPYNMTGSYQNLLSQVGGGDVVAVLQDDNDRFDPVDYPQKQEPLTYTWGVTSANRVDLMWDEYVRWNQVDDKGHWYTNQSFRQTGVDRGNPDTNDTTTLYRVNRGSRQVDYVHRHYYCADYDWVDTDGDGWVDSYRCVDYDYWNHYHYTTCTGSYPTRIGYNYNTRGYYRDSVQSRFGWYNSNTTFRNMPYGSHGSTRPSGFWYSYSSNPYWTNTGNTYHWQDTGVTSMSNAGASNKPGHSLRWQYNTTDPAYNNRHIFNRYTRPSFRTGWYRTSYRCTYPNGSANAYTANVATHYPNASYLYENSSSADGRVYGKYNFSYDGNKNGYVDYRWSWRSNYQRVRYENTYNDHYRKLGPRSATGTPRDDNILYGLRPGHSNLNERRIKVSRTTGEIVSPSIAIGEADVFAAGGIDSYFANSFADSAFLFSNQGIRHFDGGNRYEQYWINPDDDRVRSSGDYATNYPSYSSINHGPNSNDPITTVLQDELGRLYASNQNVNNSDFGGTFDLGQSGSRTYLYDGGGELEVGGTRFCGGAGTIIVEGDLVIDEDINYCNAGSSDIEDIPVVGFLVFGDIDIRPNVRNVHGAYFATGTIHTGSVLLNENGNGEVPDDNRSESDVPLNVRGLMIAHRFILARQLSGDDNRNLETESFEYDGRIILNSPPGFDYIYRFPAAWNEAAPREE